MFSHHRNLIVLAVVILSQLLLLAYQVRQDRNIPLVRYGTVLLVSPAQKSLHAVTKSVGSLWQSYVDLRGVRRENAELLRELQQLQLDNQRLQSAAEAGQRLQRLLELEQQAPYTMVAAQVIGSDAAGTSSTLLLDKGSNAGIRPDQPVIVPEGIVGKVLHVFPHAAQVLRITDANSGVACLLEDSRIHGILKGENHPIGTLGYVPNDEPVQVGQRLLTSGEDRIYPKGLPVGVIVGARPGSEFQQIQVQPLAQLNRLEEVLVIVGVEGEAEQPGPPPAEETAGELGREVSGGPAPSPATEVSPAQSSRTRIGNSSPPASSP